ncbi:uncharacterized protein LOC127862027 [Dreissena polymorpha]|uniref:Fibronectin type-III domain-containing protein n=1 Tax=Dreissena polymorpha TaxID=45954 RepID=A0A9D3YG35_DREPO|nr:uncharacterized protein LOC127862027 [Dreissena polymorpha]XP_052256919.1 uncharacterized protein LOC127862027 [Dreissena polymorpha]KAH3697919.1 hypothetical protein DPMN_085431 [Dreissena polymorpha]
MSDFTNQKRIEIDEHISANENHAETLLENPVGEVKGHESREEDKDLVTDTSNKLSLMDKSSEQFETTEDETGFNQLNLQERSNANVNESLAVEYSAKCAPCQCQNKINAASTLCTDCEELLCDGCTLQHKSLKATRSHTLQELKQKEMITETHTDMPTLQAKSFSEKKTNQRQPGQPRASGVTADTITLVWEKPIQMQDDDYFQIGYKEIKTDSKWEIFKDEFKDSTHDLIRMKADTSYMFRVRLVSEYEFGPYSEESEVVRTPKSTATYLVENAERITDATSIPIRYALPLIELKSARNTASKTRKFEVKGLRATQSLKEKTFLIIGETGTGKSTLVDGMANYILGVKWDDPFRFNMVNLEDEEKIKTKSQALSQTEWITCYTIPEQVGSRVPYTVTIIDTPGFGDTRGLQQDQKIVKQIRELFEAQPPKGVVFIDAICFLVKAPDARLTPTQSYIFESIMSLFGKDMQHNICALITFADGNQPSVLAALKESNLPFGKHFKFNNSGLFTNNEDCQSGFSRKFWKMGLTSFRDLFLHVDTLNTKSLQQTTDVLKQRHRLETALDNLQKKLELGLGLVRSLEGEINLFETHKAEIAQNQNFTYIVQTLKLEKIPLPSGQHVTNCTHCHITCHENCVFADDNEKQNCAVMSNGKCTVCKDQCHWQKHANTKYIIKHFMVDEEHTYAEKKAKYEEAGKLKLSQEQVLAKMNGELQVMANIIDEMLIEIKECNSKLSEIALRPNPLNLVNHIELLIENEKMQGKHGFQDRISVLNEFRKRAEAGIKGAKFRQAASAIMMVEPKQQNQTVIQKFCSFFGL